MADLLAGTVISGADVTATASHNETTDQTGITSTSFVAGSPVCGVAFIAPTTGRVLVMWGGELDHNTAGRETYLSFEVREGSVVGSGTVVYAADDSWSASNQGVNNCGAGVMHDVPDLTPGATYNVRLMHRVTVGGNGAVTRREVSVQPLP